MRECPFRRKDPAPAGSDASNSNSNSNTTLLSSPSLNTLFTHHCDYAAIAIPCKHSPRPNMQADPSRDKDYSFARLCDLKAHVTLKM